MTDARAQLEQREAELRNSPPEAYLPSDKPRRIQLSRKKGWRLPPNAMSVARPTHWGNPYAVGKPEQGPSRPTASEAVAAFRKWLAVHRRGWRDEFLAPLRGKHLACWCALDAPCHADVLLELANGKPAQ